MIRVLFVDDEPMLLQGLRRMLRSKRGDWDMAFAESGEDALAAIAASPVDIVVSDFRMPRMDGGELLGEVRRRHPDIARLVMSGFAEDEGILRTIDPAHQFLSKPCPAERLIDVVSRVAAARDALGPGEVRRFMTGLSSLPAARAAHESLAAQCAAMAPVSTVAETLAGDVALAAGAWRLTNSGFFGPSAGIPDIVRAAEALGLETLDAVLAESTIFHPLAGDGDAAHWDAANRAAVARTAVTRQFARHAGLAPQVADDAACAAMILDIGALALALMPNGPDGNAAAVTVYLATLWGFRAPIVNALSRFADTGSETGPDAAAVLHVAAGLTPNVDGSAAAGIDPSRLAAGLADAFETFRRATDAQIRMAG